MDYLCAKLAILVSAVLVLSCDRQTDGQNHRETETEGKGPKIQRCLED